MEFATIRSGLKAGQTAINLLDADISVADRSCGWNEAGTLTYSQVIIDMVEKQTKQALCPTDLRDFYLSEKLSASAHAEEVPFEEVVSNLFVEKIKNYNETYVGGQLIAQATVANGAQDSGQTATSTPGTIVDDVLDLFDAIPEEVKDRDDLVVIMSPANYQMLRRALVALDYYHYNQADGSTLEIPGANIKAVKSSGFVNTDAMIAGPSKDMIIGVGLEDDFDTLKIFYSADNDEVRVMGAWRLGVGLVDVTKFAKNGTL